ncbi:MAG: hypothetical protein OJF52_004243 [Nitrospira sp.]|nr:MAG: hypothetical protein OJF52_004243 [Nitrospira sp.]
MNRANWMSYVVVLSAWVLWSETFPPLGQKPGKEDWRILDAWETKAECIRGRSQFITDAMPNYRARNPSSQIRATEKEILFEEDNKTLLTITYHCLPDSIDPRPR